jgi:SAM-dependent methyltransferase
VVEKLNSDIKCVVCEGTNLAWLTDQPEDYEYFVRPFRNFREIYCSMCGSTFLYPRPTVDEIISFYPEDYWAYHKEHGLITTLLLSVRSKFRAWQIGRMAAGKPVSIFEIGPGDCSHFDEIKRYGEFTFAGVEINPEMVNLAAKKGYNIELGTLEEIDITPHRGKFDIVFMYHIIEHVLEPKLFVEKVYSLLRQGGSIIGQLPCMDGLERRLFGRYWAGYHYPRHLQIPSRKGIEDVLRRAGFEDMSIRTALNVQPAISLQNLLVGKLGYKTKMRYGKTPLYTLTLMLAAPFCILEYALNKGCIINIQAKKPVKRG